MRNVKVLITVKVPDGLEDEYSRDILRRLKDEATRIVHGAGHGLKWSSAKTYVSAELIKGD